MNKYDLQGRVAIVTGGAQGIGLAVAQRMMENGAQVALWDRDSKRLAQTAEDLQNKAFAVEVDIADTQSVAAGVEATMKKFGKIDILINNAALIGPNATLVDYPVDEFEAVVAVGLTGTFKVCKAVVPHMSAAGYGRIVNVASVAGKEGNPNACAYSSTKAAVIALTKGLGKELAAENIAVNCVTPAVAKTKGAMEQSEEHIAYMLSKIPRGRMMELDEAASMISWLSTEENSFTTGAVFDLSGGRATY
ncbi:MAG: SDR family NAD(P)-dependent oxidoreductase [Rhizobiaceae bacterium]|nr:SDR family NAD(P)-dependent oxidoreductase [Rhizobiaceae bacterium]